MIERAAFLRKWSPGKLLRDAAIRRAADIVNSDGANRMQLERLAAQLKAQLLAPEAAWIPVDTGEAAEAARARNREAERKAGVREGELPGEMYGPEEKGEWVGRGLSEPQLNQILMALHTCPTEFASILAASIERQEREVERQEYVPEVVLGSEPTVSEGENET